MVVEILGFKQMSAFFFNQAEIGFYRCWGEGSSKRLGVVLKYTFERGRRRSRLSSSCWMCFGWRGWLSSHQAESYGMVSNSAAFSSCTDFRVCRSLRSDALLRSNSAPWLLRPDLAASSQRRSFRLCGLRSHRLWCRNHHLLADFQHLLHTSGPL